VTRVFVVPGTDLQVSSLAASFALLNMSIHGASSSYESH
jgi:hypothetical protein